MTITFYLPPVLLPRCTPRWRARLASLFIVAVAALPVAAKDAGRTNELVAVHFAFSKAMFKDINENDAMAAMKVYSKNIGDEGGVDTSFGPIYLDGTNAIAEALRRKQIDMISLTSEEYLALEDQGLSGPLLLSTVNQTVIEEYVLLARNDSPVRSIEDLKGHSLIVANDIRASLVPIWLEVLCRQHGLGPANQVFAKITSASKTTQVVLPVFFGKADACVTTRNGWEVMGELNPQVKKQLRAIAVSAPVVPGMACFRRDLSEPLKERILKTAESSRGKPSFMQLMALFKTDQLSRQPVSVLTNTRQLMATYHQLCAGTNDSKATVQASGMTTSQTERKESK